MAKVVELPKLEVNEETKTGGNGHKLSLRQRAARWLLKDVHIDKLYIGDHTTVLENDIIKMNPLASDPGTPAEGWLWFLAAAAHKLRFRDNAAVKDVGEGAAPGVHDLAGAQHGPDTLANLNSKVSDGTLDKTTDKRDPNAHALAGAEHSVDTLANLNAKVSDADLANEAEVIKKDGSVAFTGDQSMGGKKLTDLPTPTTGSEPATRDFVDSKIQGLDWQNSVLDELATPPGSPTEGDRYLVIATATGDWVGHEDDIAEWNGTTWDFTTPNLGFAVWIEATTIQKVWNGTAWVRLGSTIDHQNLTGVTATSHHDNVNDPAAGEKAALPGTSGTPGAANKFVTDADPRNTNARTPTAHDHSGETLSPTVINVGDIGFKNGFRLTEDKKYGVVLVSPEGRKFRMVKC